jgi:hypothetical protein
MHLNCLRFAQVSYFGFSAGPYECWGGESTRALTKVNCELFFVTNSGQQIRAKVRP